MPRRCRCWCRAKADVDIARATGNGSTPTIVAARLGNAAALRALVCVHAKADVGKTRTNDGRAPMIAASRQQGETEKSCACWVMA